MLIGSLEAGETKFVCTVGNSNYQIKDTVTFPTEDPAITLEKVVAYFHNFNLASLGIATFGPIELNKEFFNYGQISSSPKLEWNGVNLYEYFSKQLEIPIALTTDVNASAYGEYVMSKLGNQHLHSLVYYTVGTGIGAGIIYDGKILGDLGHPEAGHIFVKRHADDLDFKGTCPFHGDCLEGLVSRPAIEARVNKKASELTKANPVWTILAFYVAQAVIQTTLTLRPQKIVLGGSLMNDHFISLIRSEFVRLLHYYVVVPKIEDYLTPAIVQNNGSAMIGNFALAIEQL
jgi:fructokinase